MKIGILILSLLSTSLVGSVFAEIPEDALPLSKNIVYKLDKISDAMIVCMQAVVDYNTISDSCYAVIKNLNTAVNSFLNITKTDIDTILYN